MSDGSALAATSDPDISAATLLGRLKRLDSLISIHAHAGSGFILLQPSIGSNPPKWECLVADSATLDACRADPKCAQALSLFAKVVLLDKELGTGRPLEDVRLAVVMGCNTGVPFTRGVGSVVDVLSEKGVHCVIATPDEVDTKLASDWEWFFWPLVTGTTDPRHRPPIPPELVWPGTIDWAARTASELAIALRPETPEADKAVLRHLVIQGSPGCQEYLFPGRYSAENAGADAGGEQQ